MCRKLVHLIVSLLAFGLVSDVSAALVGRWKLDEGSGTTAADATGNGHNGTLQGNPQWVEGLFGGALEFGGNPDRVDVPYSEQLNPENEFSVTVWANVDPAGSGHRSPITSRDDTPQRGYIIYCTPGNVWQFWIGAGSGWANVTGPDVELGEWTHVSGVYSADGLKLYVNGDLEAEGAGTLSPNTQQRVSIGAGATEGEGGNYYFVGKIDDVRVYDTALSQEHIKTVMDVKPYTFAQSPDPADGAVHEATWVNMSWRAGDLAVTHDVYMGDNFDDVNNGTASAFQGNQASTFFTVGFPGFPFSDGLVPGTTYYWRVDEVNDADPNSPWKGDVWSFLVRPNAAWQPSPPDGMRFVDPNENLSWKPGMGARLYQVYIGENFDDVNSATDAPMITETTYDPGPLELDKTYYWRVDGLDSQMTVTRGALWSFTVTQGGGGLLGTYYNNENLSGIPIVTRVDPQINFDWGDGTPDESIEASPYSARWLGEVEAVFTEPYKFTAVVGDGVRLWLNGELIIDQWVVGGALPYPSKPVDLVAGLTYSVRMEYVNSSWWPAAAQLFWSSASTPQQLIPQGALSLPVKAGSPKPAMGGVDVSNTPTLKWMAGIHAVQQEVYFGTDANAVKNATTASPEHKETLELGSESYKPGKLDIATTYYWRVDQVNSVNPDSPWVGNVWSFTTGEFITVDDFEDYDVGNNEIWWSWKDGLGYPAREDKGIPAYSGNGTGSIVGDETSPTYTEMTAVHGGSQSMPLLYDNNKQGYAKYSETELTLPAGKRDWTAEGVSELSLWFRGEEDNAAERLYVAVAGTAVMYHDDPNAAQLVNWTEWIIPLQRLADEGVSLTSVDSIAIGLGTRGNTTIPGGAGTMYIDDIRLYWPEPQP
jgi:hypothetical protein